MGANVGRRLEAVVDDDLGRGAGRPPAARGARAHLEAIRDAALLDRAVPGLVLTTPQGRITFADRIARTMLGTALAGRTMTDAVQVTDPAGWCAFLHRLESLPHGGESFTADVRRGDDVVTLRFEAAVLPQGPGGGLAITVSRAARPRGDAGATGRETWEWLAPLLPEFSSTGGAFVALVDVDGLAAVNATRSFRAGDEVLRHVARTAVRLVGGSGFVGRTASSTFMTVLLVERLSTALTAVNGILTAVRAPIETSHGAVCVTATAGMVHALPWSTPEQVVTAATEALGRAKAACRGRCVVAAPFPAA